MKLNKLFFVLTSILFSINVCSQSVWDSEKYMYKSYDYGFVWTFPNFAKWEEEVTLEKHTVFKVRQPDLGIVVYMNVNDTPIKDYWQQYDLFLQLMEKSLIVMNKNTGAEIYDKSYKKFLLAGQHAIEVKYKFTIKDDRYDRPIKTSVVSYYYISNKRSYILTLQAPTEVFTFKGFEEEIASEIFKGYHILYSKKQN